MAQAQRVLSLLARSLLAPIPRRGWHVILVVCGGGEIVSHGYLSPWNTVYRHGIPVGFIDWDAAQPVEPLADSPQRFGAWSGAGRQGGASGAGPRAGEVGRGRR